MNILVTKQLPEALQLEETVMTGQVLLVLSDFYVECSWVSLQGTLNNWNPCTQTSNVMKSLKKNFRGIQPDLGFWLGFFCLLSNKQQK